MRLRVAPSTDARRQMKDPLVLRSKRRRRVDSSPGTVNDLLRADWRLCADTIPLVGRVSCSSDVAHAANRVGAVSRMDRASDQPRMPSIISCSSSVRSKSDAQFRADVVSLVDDPWSPGNRRIDRQSLRFSTSVQHGSARMDSHCGPDGDGIPWTNGL